MKTTQHLDLGELNRKEWLIIFEELNAGDYLNSEGKKHLRMLKVCSSGKGGL